MKNQPALIKCLSKSRKDSRSFFHVRDIADMIGVTARHSAAGYNGRGHFLGGEKIESCALCEKYDFVRKQDPGIYTTGPWLPHSLLLDTEPRKNARPKNETVRKRRTVSSIARVIDFIILTRQSRPILQLVCGHQQRFGRPPRSLKSPYLSYHTTATCCVCISPLTLSYQGRRRKSHRGGHSFFWSFQSPARVGRMVCARGTGGRSREKMSHAILGIVHEDSSAWEKELREPALCTTAAAYVVIFSDCDIRKLQK